MKKILFLLACLWLVLPFPSRAEKATSSVSAANGESEELKIIPLRPTGDPLVNTSSGLEEYWFRLFMLYRHPSPILRNPSQLLLSNHAC